MKQYIRIMLGKGGIYAAEGFARGFLGAGFGVEQDLSEMLTEDMKAFNKALIPIYLKNRPDKSKVAAGLACGSLWKISKGMKVGDIVLCPDGSGNYKVGEVSGEYFYEPGGVLPHRRKVKWRSEMIPRVDMSEALQNSTGAIQTLSDISKHEEEIESLIRGTAPPAIISTDETVEDPKAFALEEHLEEFLVKNWSDTVLGKDYEIFEDEGEQVGQQYPVETGNIDILAIRKDKMELLVVELKKGKASDKAVGQVLRYMGDVQEELLEEGQSVKGLIIAHDDDLKIRRALATLPNIEFYRYQLSFKLQKV